MSKNNYGPLSDNDALEGLKLFNNNAGVEKTDFGSKWSSEGMMLKVEIEALSRTDLSKKTNRLKLFEALAKQREHKKRIAGVIHPSNDPHPGG